jgi:phage-related protein (TIGR01555 family)
LGLFSTQGDGIAPSGERPFANGLPVPEIPKPSVTLGGTVGMDDYDEPGDLKYNLTQINGVPEAQLAWFGSQTFIGYQLCAIIAQHWLVYKACAMPGRDAVRNGYELSFDGDTIPDKLLARIKRADKFMKIKWQLQEYLCKGRIFGIRHAYYRVENGDPDYYEKPFNIDSVTPGSYKGIVQIDPYWITPETTQRNLRDPSDPSFYEPDYWRVSGKLFHKSHLCIYTTGPVGDILKPAYLYGGVSIPQRIYERVYAAERTANEAPMLTMTKRLNVMKTDLTAAIANPDLFAERMGWAAAQRDNYGTRFVGPDDEIEQFDLGLTDLDGVIMTQYQIVAAVAEVPGTKLMGTQPKGFNSTGEFEESSYHESLESIEENDLTPLLDGHYFRLMASLGVSTIGVEISWNELDAMTAQEQAQVNATKIATDAAAIACGAIESQDSRNRLRNDPDSGYTDLAPDVPAMPDDPAEPGAPAAGTPAAAQAVAATLPHPGKPHPETGA